MTVRRIEVRERVMARNDELAREVRARLARHRVAALNLVSSPGSGKTTLLERTLSELGHEVRFAVVAGDVQTDNDAQRVAAHTSRLVQAVVTGGACHLDASQVSDALDHIDLDDTDLLFIENVGNLVCPASWDLGEDEKVVLFAVTEGEDKPLKYPKMFQNASVAVLTKADLLPWVPFDLERARQSLYEINPDLTVLTLSAFHGEGLEPWFDLLRSRVRRGALVG
ncbi:MAG: hydrogenase nickel incorporation protein HypB [Gemmatimonadota bacterium]